MDEEKERPQNYSEAEYGAQQKETPKESAEADPTGQVREKLESEGLPPEAGRRQTK